MPSQHQAVAAPLSCGGGQGPPRVPPVCVSPPGTTGAGCRRSDAPKLTVLTPTPGQQHVGLARRRAGSPWGRGCRCSPGHHSPPEASNRVPPLQDHSDREPAPQPPPLQHPGWALPSQNSLWGSCKCLYAPKGATHPPPRRGSRGTGYPKLAHTGQREGTRGWCYTQPLPPPHAPGVSPIIYWCSGTGLASHQRAPISTG